MVNTMVAGAAITVTPKGLAEVGPEATRRADDNWLDMRGKVRYGSLYDIFIKYVLDGSAAGVRIAQVSSLIKIKVKGKGFASAALIA